jgi:integrase
MRDPVQCLTIRSIGRLGFPELLAPSIERANRILADDGEAPLPDGITPHSLRRTFASILYATGEDATVVMAEMGHSDPKLALAIYARVMRRDQGEKERLKALVGGAQLALIGTPTVLLADAEVEREVT